MANEFQSIDSGQAVLKNDYMGQAIRRRKKKVADKPKPADNRTKKGKHGN